MSELGGWLRTVAGRVGVDDLLAIAGLSLVWHGLDQLWPAVAEAIVGALLLVYSYAVGRG